MEQSKCCEWPTGWARIGGNTHSGYQLLYFMSHVLNNVIQHVISDTVAWVTLHL